MKTAWQSDTRLLNYNELVKTIPVFYTCVYIPYFLRCSIGADAPFNDLQLLKNLSSFDDSDLASAALAVLGRHGWYTAQQTVVFALFSNRVDDETKAMMAERILSFEPPAVFSLEMPEFQTLTTETKLQDLCGPNSYQLFAILGVSFEWLREDPQHWQDDESFTEIAEYVRTTKTVNDCAERGVKLITDYSKILTKDETTRRIIVQGVEMIRARYPDMKKSTLNASVSW